MWEYLGFCVYVNGFVTRILILSFMSRSDQFSLGAELILCLEMMLNMRAVSSLVGKRTQLLRYATRRGFSFITQGGPAEQSVSAVSKRGAESSSKKVLGTILFGVMALTTAGLGCWQADR